LFVLLLPHAAAKTTKTDMMNISVIFLNGFTS